MYSVYLVMLYIAEKLTPQPSEKLKANVPTEERCERSFIAKYLTEKQIFDNYSLEIKEMKLVPEEKICLACKNQLEDRVVSKKLKVLDLDNCD